MYVHEREKAGELIDSLIDYLICASHIQDIGINFSRNNKIDGLHWLQMNLGRGKGRARKMK